MVRTRRDFLKDAGLVSLSLIDFTGCLTDNDYRGTHFINKRKNLPRDVLLYKAKSWGSKKQIDVYFYELDNKTYIIYPDDPIYQEAEKRFKNKLLDDKN